MPIAFKELESQVAVLVSPLFEKAVNLAANFVRLPQMMQSPVGGCHKQAASRSASRMQNYGLQARIDRAKREVLHPTWHR